MNDLPELPAASRSWRDIPQQVKPRAMSREGRRRYVFSGLKTFAVVATIAGLVVATVVLARTWSANPAWFSTASGQPPVRTLVLETNGRLSDQWLRATLALPAGITLLELDLAALQRRLLANRQVGSAEVAMILPATLAVTLKERVPVARLPGDGMLLVARDGVVFRGEGFDAETLTRLPLLTGAGAGEPDGTPGRVAGMEHVADLLGRARDLAPHLLERWQEVNVSRLELDGQIEVRSTEIPRILFNAGADFSDQLARLDAVRDRAPGPLQLVNVGLGPRVIAEPAVAAATRPTGRPAPATSRAPLFQLNFDP